MKKILSLLVIAGLSWMTVGCSGDPGVSVDAEVTPEELEENATMGADIASEAALAEPAAAEPRP